MMIGHVAMFLKWHSKVKVVVLCRPPIHSNLGGMKQPEFIALLDLALQQADKNHTEIKTHM